MFDILALKITRKIIKSWQLLSYSSTAYIDQFNLKKWLNDIENGI